MCFGIRKIKFGWNFSCYFILIKLNSLKIITAALQTIMKNDTSSIEDETLFNDETLSEIFNENSLFNKVGKNI